MVDPCRSPAMVKLRVTMKLLQLEKKTETRDQVPESNVAPELPRSSNQTSSAEARLLTLPSEELEAMEDNILEQRKAGSASN